VVAALVEPGPRPIARPKAGQDSLVVRVKWLLTKERFDQAYVLVVVKIPRQFWVQILAEGYANPLSFERKR
jgi:hypothetical protein